MKPNFIAYIQGKLPYRETTTHYAAAYMKVRLITAYMKISWDDFFSHVCTVCVPMFYSGVGLAADHAIWQQPPCVLRMLGLNCFFVAFFLLFKRHAVTFPSPGNKTTAAWWKITHKSREKRGKLRAIFHSGSLQVTVCHGAQYRRMTQCVCV